MTRKHTWWLGFLAWLLFGSGSVVEAQKVYWTNSGTTNSAVLRADLNGANQQTLITTTSHESRDIVLDLVAKKLYFVTVGNFGTDCRIRRANLDGSMTQDVVLTGSLFPNALAIDATGGKIYWHEDNSTIRRANLDGTSASTIHTASNIEGLALDPLGGKLYWMINTGLDGATLRRANLDGTSPQDVATVTGELMAPSLAIGGGRIYWSRLLPDNALRSVNLDGTDLQVTTNQFSELAFDMAIDDSQNKVYWTQPGGNGFVFRANIDLSGIQTVYSGTASAPPAYLALDLSSHVPALSQWMVLLFAAIILVCGGTIIRRRSSVPPGT